jgi:hypothetical protein
MMKLFFSELKRLTMSDKINAIFTLCQLVTAVSSLSIAIFAYSWQFEIQRHQLELNQREADAKANAVMVQTVIESTGSEFHLNN